MTFAELLHDGNYRLDVVQIGDSGAEHLHQLLLLRCEVLRKQRTHARSNREQPITREFGCLSGNGRDLCEV
jgi:hypothetical protein